MPGTGVEGIWMGNEIFKDILLGHEIKFRIIFGVWKNPQDIPKEINIVLSITSIKNNQESLVVSKN